MSASFSQQRNGGDTAGKKQPTGDYPVGYCRPPQHTKFKSGHRSRGGRRRGSLDPRTVFDRTMKMKVPVRKGNKTQEMPAFQAMIESQTLKAVQGDARSLAKVIDLGAKLRFFSPEHETGEASAPVQAPIMKSRPSDELVESVDRTLLDRHEQAELARLAELIDRGGDITVLSAAEFLRFKDLVAKGRGKDAQGDKPVDQAA